MFIYHWIHPSLLQLSSSGSLDISEVTTKSLKMELYCEQNLLFSSQKMMSFIISLHAAHSTVTIVNSFYKYLNTQEAIKRRSVYSYRLELFSSYSITTDGYLKTLFCI
jgi:hypothetical protein